MAKTLKIKLESPIYKELIKFSKKNAVSPPKLTEALVSISLSRLGNRDANFDIQFIDFIMATKSNPTQVKCVDECMSIKIDLSSAQLDPTTDI